VQPQDPAHVLQLSPCLAAQVKKAGALHASAVESDEEMEEISRIRKPTVIAVIVIFTLSMIVWPLLTLPAGVFRCVGKLGCLSWRPVPVLPQRSPCATSHHCSFVLIDPLPGSVLSAWS
jgi:hypothetical protein